MGEGLSCPRKCCQCRNTFWCERKCNDPKFPDDYVLPMCIQRRLKAKPSGGASATPAPAGVQLPEQPKPTTEPDKTEERAQSKDTSPTPARAPSSSPARAPQKYTETWDSVDSISFAPRSFERIANDLSNPLAVQAEVGQSEKNQENLRRQRQKEQFLGALLDRECYALFRCDLAAFESEFLASRGESSKGYGREEQARIYFERRASQAKSLGKESDQSKAVPVRAAHQSE